MQPGWFPDPDDPNARRYWDGANWSAPLPNSLPSAANTTPSDVDPAPAMPASGNWLDLSDSPKSETQLRIEAAQADMAAAQDRLDRLHSPDPSVRAAAMAETQGRADQEIRTCAVGPCAAPRLQGQQFCARHISAAANIAARPAPRTGAAAIVCPHCHNQGRVTRRRVKQKKGISGGKATAAVFTAGFSMLGTGLSRKERVTEMCCASCGTTWYV